MAAKSTSHWPITLTNGTAAVLNLFLPLALVRILSPDQMGRYKIFFLYVILSPGLFMATGFTNGLYHWVGKYPEAKSEVRQSWTLLNILVFAMSALGLLLSRHLAALVRMPTFDMQLILISVPFTLVATFLEDLMIARGSIWSGSFYGSGFNVLRGASMLVAAWWTRSILCVLWAFVMTTVIRALSGWAILARTGEITPLFSQKKAMNVLRYALPVSIGALAALALQYVDQMILSFRLSPARFAIYAIACLSIPPLDILEMSVNRVMIPKLSQAFAAADHSKAAALFSEGVSELFRFLLPATVGLIIYSQPIIRVLFTQRYMASAHFLQYYAFVYLFMTFPYDAVARARGDGRWILRTTLLFAILSIVATWYAAGRFNSMGALSAVLISQLLMRLYSMGYIRRYFTSFSEFLPLKEMLLQSGIALTAAACSLILRPLFSDLRTWFLVTGPLFTLIYFGALYSISLRRLSTVPGTIHVLELAQSLGLGGLERMIYSLALELHQRPGFEVLVATYDHRSGDPSLEPQFREAGIPLVQWQKRKGFSLRSVFRLIYIIFSNDTRVLHVHDLGPLIYGSLAKILSLGRVRLFVTLHTLLDIKNNRRYRLYYKLFLRFPDRIIAVSSGVQTGLLALGIKARRIEVIPNGVTFSLSSLVSCGHSKKQFLRKSLMPGMTSDIYTKRWLLCLARLHTGKGQNLVLDIWRVLPEATRERLCLFFVGQETQTGYRDLLLRMIREIPDHDRVFIVGPSERPQEWIHASDLFVSGSLLEGMPLAPLEAAGSGLPNILSDIEGHQFLSPWAYYFDLKKPEDGAKRILEILKMMKSNGELKFFEDQWSGSASLRKKWDAPTMAASYAETFQFAGSS